MPYMQMRRQQTAERKAPFRATRQRTKEQARPRTKNLAEQPRIAAAGLDHGAHGAALESGVPLSHEAFQG